MQLVGDGIGGGDWYLKSVMAGNRDAAESGIRVDGGAAVLDVIASADGAVVEGVVADAKGVPVADAVLVAAPELRLRGREDRYRKMVTDQNGHFIFHGVPPGSYTLFAWESIEGEPYYNPEFLKNYESRGVALRVAEGERKSVEAQVIAESENLP